MTKILNPKQFKNVITFFIIGFVLFPAVTLGAKLYLEPASGEYQPGDTFIVEVKIDTEEECINAVEAKLKFSQDVLEAVDFSQGSSILTLWPKVPEINQASGLVSFAGGIPGGYCGEIPGDPGPSHLLGKLVFRVRETDAKQVEIVFQEDSQVLLNDGLGTSAKLKTRGSVFTILPEKAEIPKDEWQEELEKDTIPPEFFEIEIGKDPAIFDGKYFIIFFSTDKQTGLDYYEVKEGERDWKRAESPYLLEDQALQSIIKVKGVDKAGNERIAEFIPSAQKPFPWWVIIMALFGVLAIFWIWKKHIKKH